MLICLFLVILIGVISCYWNLVFAIFRVCIFCSEIFGGGFDIVPEGVEEVLEGES